ncbi:transposase [Streptomyces erythrochromogenes]|uniref:transposase n=1 Tax=Streptomyces erythrochromogenes TaxID=285574 RepID=UPI0036CC9EE0
MPVCRCDGVRQTIPGWPYQVAAALGGGRTSWTGLLDAVRLGPDDDATAVTAARIRNLLRRLREAGQWSGGDPRVLFVLDSGYDIVRLAWLLRDEPARLLGRIRSDRVMHRPAGRRRGPAKGRQPRHGEAFRLAVTGQPTPLRPGHPSPRTTGSVSSPPAAGDVCTRNGNAAGRGPATRAGHPSRKEP